jgi:hypothetical protein
VSLAAWYFHKVDQCAQLADDAAEPYVRAKFLSERHSWLQILATEIGTDETILDATIARLPSDGAT